MISFDQLLRRMAIAHNRQADRGVLDSDAISDRTVIRHEEIDGSRSAWLPRRGAIELIVIGATSNNSSLIKAISSSYLFVFIIPSASG